MKKYNKVQPKRLWYIISIIILFWSAAGMAQNKIDSLKIAVKQETSDSLKIELALNLSRKIHRSEHDEEVEYSYAQEAIQMALENKDTLLYARALDNLGLLYRYHQQYDEALSRHKKAFELVKNKEVDPVYKMVFANNAGVAARYDQKYDLAVSYYMKALKIAEKENDLRNIAISNNGIGNALSNIPGRGDEALKYFQRSLAAEQKRNNSLGIAMNYLSISDHYIEKEEYKQAREYLDKLLKINKQRNDLYGLAITYEYYGKSYLEEGKNLEKAAAYFHNALERFENLNDVHKQAELFFSLGNIQLKQNQISKAKELFHNSLEMAEKINNQGLMMHNSYKLAELYERENNLDRALYFIKQGQLYEDSIKLTEQNIKIASLIRKYNLEKKENHIRLLEKDKALQQTLLENQEQKLARRNIFIGLMGSGIFFILLISFLQYRNSQIKKKTNAIIQREEKEKMKAIYERNLAQAEILVTRLRVNPHFLFNCLNAITYLIQSGQNRKATKYLVVFSRYTRMVLETSQKHVVPVTEEIKLTKYYLTLEENRFEKDFTYKIIGDDIPEIKEISIPPLLLQPFIENAIWHGLLPSKCDKKILLIEIIPAKDWLQIIIDDNGVGRKSTKVVNAEKKHKSMGMEIIKERIDLFNKSYSGNIEYEIIDKKNENGAPEGTRIILRIQTPPKS